MEQNVTDMLTTLETTLKQAILLHRSGNLGQAEALYNSLIMQFPKGPDAYHLLGTLYHQKGEHRIAIELIKKALKINPRKAVFHNNIGHAYRESGEAQDAEKSFRKAIKLKSNYTSAMNNLGGMILEKGNISSAISVFKKILKIDPAYHPARHNLGNAYYEKGENEKAILCYRTVMQQNPNYTKAARNLAETKKFREEDEDYKRLEKLAVNPDFSGENKANVLFAFAKAQEDLKKNKEAFTTYLKANRTYRDTYQLFFDQIVHEFDEIKSTITEDFYKKHQGDGTQSSRPIFVLGMPRSGTSLVEQILSSHPQVYGAGEVHAFNKTCFNLIREKGKRPFSEAFDNCQSTFIQDLGNDYIRQLKALPTKASFVVDKMPQNFLYVGLIKLILPQAKIIHCRRAAEDTCLSIFKKHFVDQQAYAYDLEELGRYYTLYLDLMAHWRTLLGDDLYDIDYEALVTDQKNETGKLLRYCGLDWHDACLEFHKTKRAVRTASTDQVRQPMYQSSIQAWRKYEEELKPLLDKL
ncbi:MAG: sulfotransferase [Sneathiella sp.]|nr:sulfotransferase [Sneathiella sp.]